MAPSAHHFIPVWQSLDAETSYRSKVYGPSKKRKRLQAAQDDSDDDDFYSYATTTSSPPASQHHQSSQSNVNPYRVAGHPEALPLPDHPFPHAPVKEPRRYTNEESIQKNLAALKPPLYVPPAPEDQDAKTSLRRHHLGVMTTIMHTALLRGDFIRAGRAWGMILRTEVLGRAIDVRTHDRWGLGAEILLRQHSVHPKNLLIRNEEDQTFERESTNNLDITQEGFQLAKDYYERLILQYPYQKTHPNAVSSLTFYPAMYGLCIYEIRQKYNQALARAERASRTPSPAYDQDEPDQAEIGDDVHGSQAKINAIKRSILDEAIALADRMTELMLSPPNDKYPPLLQLRVMLGLWIIDLSNDVTGTDERLLSLFDLKVEREKSIARKFMAEMDRTGAELPEFFNLGD